MTEQEKLDEKKHLAYDAVAKYLHAKAHPGMRWVGNKILFNMPAIGIKCLLNVDLDSILVYNKNTKAWED